MDEEISFWINQEKDNRNKASDRTTFSFPLFACIPLDNPSLLTPNLKRTKASWRVVLSVLF